MNYISFVVMKMVKKVVQKYWKDLWTWALYSEFLRDLYKWRVKTFPLFMPKPYYVEIETTTKCPYKCVMCEHTYWKEPAINMTFEQFKKIINDIPQLKWVGMTGIGESFMNPDYMKMLRYTRSKGINIEMFDPFMMITKKKAEELLDLGIEVLYISMDGATKKTYEKIRRGVNFDTVLKNVRTFIKLKKERDLKKPVIIFYYTVSKLNYHEIEKFLELVKSFELEKPRVVYTPTLHFYKEIKNLYIEVPKERSQKLIEMGKEYGIDVEWNDNTPPMEERRPITKCFAWLMPFIFANGNVICCCATNEANRRDFQNQHSFGNIFEQSFDEIWNGKKFKDFRKKLLKGNTPIQCGYCTLYNTKCKK